MRRLSVWRLGTMTSSFLMVKIFVYRNVFSMTSPTVSPSFTRSPS